MRLPTILKQYNEQEILDHLFELYPDQKKSEEGYIEVLNSLRHQKPEVNPMLLLVERIEDDGQKWVSVSGLNTDEIQHYAIEFTPWSEWLGMHIHPLSFKEFTPLDILCHCLWEMTWDGFNEKEIQGKFKNLTDIVKEIEEDGKTKN